VGSGGLVIDDLGNRWELPATLRDVIDVDGDSNIAGTLVREPRLIVVGDNGFVAVAAHPDGAEIGFDVEMVGTDADLWAVTAMRNSKFFAIVAGDDVLIVGREDEHGELVWTHPPAPPDGWGRLRALGSPRKLIGASLG